MEYLKDLISVVNKNKTKHIEIIGNDRSKDQKLYRLYDGIINEEFNTDSQACRKLYGTNNLGKGYRNLKSRLEKRALNTIFFLDLNSPSYNDLQKAHYNCYKNLAASKILLGRGARKSSIKLSEKTLRIALKFELYDVAIPLLQDLRNHYGSLLGDQKRLKKYNSIIQQLKKDKDYEELAREMYDTLSSHLVHSKIIQPFQIKMAETYAEELEPYFEKTTYSQFHLYANIVSVLRYQMVNNHEGTIKACNRALNFFQKKEHYSNNYIFTFLFKRFTSLIQLRQYEAADLDAKKCLTLVPKGKLNWFLTCQLYILLLFHSGKLQEAFAFYLEVKTIRNKKKANLEIGKKFWNIIEAYIDYFIQVKKIEIPDKKRKPRFDYNSFSNKKTEYSKDKRGMNITILVLQVLFLLNENKNNDKTRDMFFEKMETLRNYTSRYLRVNENFRSNCFIKMLLKISDSNFNRIALERNTKDLLKKLKSKPLEVADKPIETEIVPFEIVWEMILESLDRKGTRRRRRK